MFEVRRFCVPHRFVRRRVNDGPDVCLREMPRGPACEAITLAIYPVIHLGDMTWTFEVVPQRNMQSVLATIRSTHLWLT